MKTENSFCTGIILNDRTVLSDRDCYGNFALFWPYGKTEISVFTFSFHSI